MPRSSLTILHLLNPGLHLPDTVVVTPPTTNRTAGAASKASSVPGPFVLAFAGYGLVTIALTYPLVRHLSSSVPHDLGDPLLSASLLWWNAHVQPLTARWWNGFAFWPSGGMPAFSDHRLGESLIASPLQWAGLGSLTAYNVTLLATFPLCAIAAHWLAYTLTGRHDASAVAGLAYGFNPYRLAHIEHLELLAGFGMPLALGALHLYLGSRRPRWLVLFGAAMVLQALLCTYYFLFFLVMLALWAAWFVRRGDGDLLAGATVALGAALVVLSPVISGFRAIHQHYGFTRGLGDIVTLSADVTSLVTASPLLALWGWTGELNGPERQLFPGLTLAVLVLLGAIVAARSRACQHDGDDGDDGGDGRAGGRAWLTLLLLGAASAFLLTTLAAWRYGPWHVGALSVSTPFKPLSLAFWALVAAGATSTAVRRAYRRRSTFAFYLLAFAALFLCSLGPKPAFLHQQILYEPPYAWLMRFRIFGESVRVPARFAMPAILALSIAGALAFARLVRYRTASWIAASTIAIGVLADGWPSRLPLVDPPQPWPATITRAGVGAFAELPLGDAFRDVAAMYRSTMIGLPTVNGYSGYMPSFYEAERIAFEERDDSLLEALASRAPLVIVVDRQAPDAPGQLDWLRNSPLAAVIATEADRQWFAVNAPPGSAPPSAAAGCDGPPVPIAAARDNRGPVDLRALTDHDQNTYWITPGPQRTGDMLLLDLGRERHVCSVQFSLGSHVSLYPRMLSVAGSDEGTDWQTSFTGSVAGRAVLAGVARPLDARIDFGLPAGPVRFIRLRLEANHPKIPWLVTELAVSAGPGE